ncbi:MAG: Ppx/GppA phosphatase [Hyphomicrobiales bacterium]|jgi:exopolyphosphatase/guanosine-5'-triphosphate,3'-diphosphate pyrophosphatase|nr:Ppx/GppA phosphatase [Hyphomicrobiales bacterium]
MEYYVSSQWTGATGAGAPPAGSSQGGGASHGGHGVAGAAHPPAQRRTSETYAALDLGTNNCRLLIARPSHEGFRIVDAFSRIVRLGEGLGHSGRLAEGAIRRTVGALAVCRDKMSARGVTRSRLIATEACRAASNGTEFLARVADEVGIDLEIVDRETEAHLAAAGCAALADRDAKSILLFDIGGGSTEIVWLARRGPGASDALRDRIRIWTSLSMGVVTLAEKFGGHDVDDETFERMVDHVSAALAPFAEKAKTEARCERFHLLGTSGTVTTLAGVHLGLARYDRRRVDGLWMSDEEVEDATDLLRNMSYDERAANGCIGHERADLVLAGCAIFEAIRRAFPAQRIRIADRGLREGILVQLMSSDGVWRHAPFREIAP